jgi:hypothetical protein
VTKRNLQDWSATAEILSSVAVLATLVFFVVEIQQTNDAVRANTYQGMAAMTVDFNSQFFENPEVAQFIARCARRSDSIACDDFGFVSNGEQYLVSIRSWHNNGTANGVVALPVNTEFSTKRKNAAGVGERC